jgi:hypothetical protein
MEMILFTGNDCKVCEDVEAKFLEKFKPLIDSKEAQVVNLDESEEAQEWWMKNDLPLAPLIVVISENKEVVAVLETDDLLKAETDTAVSEVSTAGVDAVTDKI